MREDPLIHSKQELFILGSGKEALEMVRVNKSGLMELCTLENGERIEHMEEANLSM